MYSFVRHFTSLLVALIFGSAFPQQEYSTYVAAVSRAAVIYVTALFTGILAMILVQPVFAAERPAFYREQQSRMYSVWMYALTLVLIEVSNIRPFCMIICKELFHFLRFLICSYHLWHLYYHSSILLDLII